MKNVVTGLSGSLWIECACPRCQHVCCLKLFYATTRYGRVFIDFIFQLTIC